MENQPESMLVELIRYNNWANAQVFAACQQLTEAQLATRAPGVYGSIHATIGHIVSAEQNYIRRLTHSSPQPPFDWEDEPPVADIVAFSKRVADALLETIQRVPPEHIVHEEEDGNTIDYKASLLFLQIIDHGIEHRTNITTLLSGLGLPELEVDGWGYLNTHPDRFALKQTFKEPPDADHQS